MHAFPGQRDTVYLAQDHERRGPGIGQHTAGGEHGNGRETVRYRLTQGRMHGVRMASAVDLDPAAIVARGGNGHVVQFHHATDFTDARCRLFYRHGPCLAIRSGRARAHFSIDTDQVAGDGPAIEAMRQLVDAKTLGDPRQVEHQRRALAHLQSRQIHVQRLGGRAVRFAMLCRDLRRWRALRRTESPVLHQLANRHVEGAARFAADQQPRSEHLRQLLRHRKPGIFRRRVQAAQVRGDVPGRHLPVDPVDGGKQAGGDGGQVRLSGRIEYGRIAAAHGFAIQAVAPQRMFRRRLHDTFLFPVAPPHPA